ncbi:Siroheme decarboxylase NirL subunit [uncultured Gammaproteobacteria bacterium]
MDLTATDRHLIAALLEGLPLVPRPYQSLGESLGLSEAQVLARLQNLLDQGVINRLGLIVRHHELGYRANAMVVWDIPDEQADEIGQRASVLPFVSLCYRRPRRLPDWPYTLFTMIHGREREAVLAQVEQVATALEIETVPRAVLFSRRRFCQRAARVS